MDSEERSPVESPDGVFAKCKRKQRRHTDFSQADNDLKHFLAERDKQKRRDSDVEISTTFFANEVSKRDVFPTRLFGSVEKLDDLVLALDPDELHQHQQSRCRGGGGDRQPRCGSLGAKDLKKLKEAIRRNGSMGANLKARRFRIENTESNIDGNDDSTLDLLGGSAPVIENPENQTLWYLKYFLGKFHHNYLGQDSNKASYVLSVVEEKSYGKVHCRCILWTKDGIKRLVIQGAHRTRSPRAILGQFEIVVDQPPREVTQADLQKDLFSLEKQERAMNLKFGVIYAKSGQITDDEFFSNETGSETFDRFLDLLGDKVTLKGWTGYKGGLDTKNNMTGETSIFTEFEEHQLMFHVSTLLPFSKEDSQQVDRKRHIGNDIVNIIFMEGTAEDAAKIQPQLIRSQFTHIYAVVWYEEECDRYRLNILSDESVPVFGPLLTNKTRFGSHEEFRRFLLIKLINGEKATYKANVFSSKRERTYEMLLQDMYDQYWPQAVGEIWDSANLSRASTGSLKLYGGRKFQDQMEDSFVKMGQSLRLESKLTGGGNRYKQGKAAKSRWEPQCVFPNFPHKILCGDSWGNSALILGTTDGLYMVTLPTKQLTLVCDKNIGIVEQVHVIQTYGIMILRSQRHRGDGGKLIVMRLNDLEEFMTSLIAWDQKVDSLLNEGTSLDETMVTKNNRINSEFNQKRPSWDPKTKQDVRQDIIEHSKGCSMFTISRPGATPLRLTFAVGRRVVLMKWRHQEEWISLNTDTAQGFDMEAEATLQETPTLLTILHGSKSNVESPVGGQGDIEEDLDSDLVAGGGGSGSSSGGGGGLCGAGLFSLSSPSVISRDINTPVCVPNMTSFVGMAVDQVKVLAGAKHHFDLVKFAVCHSSRSYAVEATRILTLGSASSTGAISATEIFYDQESEVLLSHNSLSHVQKLEANAARTHPIEWNSVPTFGVVCAFPYILAFSSDSIEFRYAVNGSLLQTLCLPDLNLLSSKDDLYLCSTKQPVATRKPRDGGYQDLEYRHIYKISWTQLVGPGDRTTQVPTSAKPTTTTTKQGPDRSRTARTASLKQTAC